MRVPCVDFTTSEAPVIVRGPAVYALVRVQGHVFEDIAADLSADDHLQSADTLEEEGKPKLREGRALVARGLRAVRLARTTPSNFHQFLQDAEALLETSLGLFDRGIELDDYEREHCRAARQDTRRSAKAGRVAIGDLEVLVGAKTDRARRAEAGGER